ncbi:MAG: CHAT domain-containing protein, partial [Myxococcales bacterium]|nr:CHAT domain-containing protein [Myxococcales bacterium]
ETGVAVAHQAAGPRSDAARVEIHLRRAAEAAEGPAIPDGGRAIDVLVPTADARLSLEGAIRRLADEGNIALARRLCAAGRRRAHPTPAVPVAQRRPRADATRALHRERFRLRHAERSAAPVEAAAWSQAAQDEPAIEWRLRAPRADEARIEYRVFTDWMLAFVVTTTETRLHRWPLGHSALRTRVDALCQPLAAGDVRLALEGAASVFRAVMAPLMADLGDVTRLIIAPDGPLSAVPFGLLWGGGFLAEYFDLAIAVPAAPPTFTDRGVEGEGRALIVGDAATARDLQLSTLIDGHGFVGVDARHGDELAPPELATALEGARFVHLVGGLDEGDGLKLIDEAPPTAARALAEALGAGGALCATAMGPVEGTAGQALVGTLLSGLRGGLLARTQPADEERSVLLRFFGHAATSTNTEALIDAFGEAVRGAIRDHVSPADWSAYTLYVAEGV